MVPFEWIEHHIAQYQRLLERQADYLLEGSTWWREVADGVEFFDKRENMNSMKQLHHFRSTNLKDESTFINECWKICLTKKN